ncbi:MAG TPA: 4Fe-4S binding protein [Gaiellaceae bacterium]|jgi:2-oxoacid:acceptor oxidoreductase delta subunit (pyruvate/2-ketoisovalerate family)
MPDLLGWRELPLGGVVEPHEDQRPHTGSYRTGLRPAVDMSKCVNCLLCWMYCPDSAVRQEAGHFTHIDLDFCKGCEICAEICPVGAIEMVKE